MLQDLRNGKKWFHCYHFGDPYTGIDQYEENLYFNPETQTYEFENMVAPYYSNAEYTYKTMTEAEVIEFLRYQSDKGSWL